MVTPKHGNPNAVMQVSKDSLKVVYKVLKVAERCLNGVCLDIVWNFYFTSWFPRCASMLVLSNSTQNLQIQLGGAHKVLEGVQYVSGMCLQECSTCGPNISCTKNFLETNIFQTQNFEQDILEQKFHMTPNFL